MEKQKVYIESSVISYLTAKPSREIITSGHQQITQDWWHKSRNKFDCYISEFVIDEISKGDKEAANKRLTAVKNLNILEYSESIDNLALTYAEIFNIPEKSKLDAFHLATAVWFEIDYLLSWNCKHIANAIVSFKLSQYNMKNGLKIPILCTPLELLEV